jgi:hypothetical protein
MSLFHQVDFPCFNIFIIALCIYGSLLLFSPLFPIISHIQHSLWQRETEEDAMYYLPKEAHDGRE